MKETILIVAWLISLVLALVALYWAMSFKIDRDYWRAIYHDLRRYADATEKHFDEAMELAQQEHRSKLIVCNDLAKRLTPEEYLQLQEVIELERLAKKD